MATAYADYFYDEVELTLTVEEAETLRVVLARVGGHRDHSPRRHTQAVAYALDTALKRDKEAIAAAIGSTAEITGNVMFWTDEPPGTRLLMESMLSTLSSLV